MKKMFQHLMTGMVAVAIGLTASLSPLVAHAEEASHKPTIVLVHGAFADSSSWDGVAGKLIADGYSVVAAANPLRSVSGDAAQVSAIVKGIDGPVILVGHSYGGSVISAAANDNGNVKGLVYVAAFAPEAGETAVELSSRFPGGTLAAALAKPVSLPDGGKDLYIDRAKFHQQFAHDVSRSKAALMAVGQRPIAEAALIEPSTEPAWKNIPSWFVYGTGDRNIPEAALRFMAERAHARKTIAIPGASHVVMTSHPTAVAKLIEEAAHFGVIGKR